MLNAAMEFEGFKFFRKEFKFKSKDQYNKYFDNALIESPLKFIRLSKADFDEKIHIAFSWMAILKIVGWVLLGMTALIILAQTSPLLGAILVGLSMLSVLGSKIAKGKLDRLAFGKSFSIQMYEMNNYENLEQGRQILIEEKELNDETPE